MGNEEKKTRGVNKTGGRKPRMEYSAGTRERTINLSIELYLKGYGYRAIANMIEERTSVTITHTTVRKYVKQALAEWKDERLQMLDEQKTLELQKISRLELTYWDEYENSKKEVKKTKNKQHATPAKKDGNAEMEVRSAYKEVATEERLGDPRYLQGIQWCIEKRCEILGIDAPTQINANLTGTINTTTVIKTRKRERPKL